MTYFQKDIFSVVCSIGILLSSHSPLIAKETLVPSRDGIETFEGKITAGDGFDARTASIIQTSKSGNKLTKIKSASFTDGNGSNTVIIELQTGVDQQRQEVVGIGGSMTQASASVLNKISAAKRQEIITRYFHPTDGIGFTVSRLVIGSSDFATESFTYSQKESLDLADFSIEPDMDDVVPLVKDALVAANGNIKLVSSAWTAPPWMKTGAREGFGGYFGGTLKNKYKDTYALFISKYIDAYAAQGIPIWAITPVNEPGGNNSSWESMTFDPNAMAAFINENLGPLMHEKHPEIKIYAFDHNKDGMHHWAKAILNHGSNRDFVDGIAIHWYSHTENHYGDELNQMHKEFPDHPTFGTEHTIDNIANDESIDDKHFFNNDGWFWEKHVGGWGAVYANPKHPFVAALHRYARDIIVDLNNWTIGWIDWNFVLDKTGGPNHVNNLCLAPVMVDTDTDEVYYTPLYYAMGHFSKFIRPGARVLTQSIKGRDGTYVTSVINRDGSIAVVILNDQVEAFGYSIRINGKFIDGSIEGNALQTILVNEPEAGLLFEN
jgi:glucosylceramidase